MTQIYEDTGRRKYNLHSWRKRCSTEYARANNESMADGYLRHSKYLAQYHQKTKEERVEAFRKAEMDLAIDETEKKNAKIKELESDKTELEKIKAELRENKINGNIKQMVTEHLLELLKDGVKLSDNETELTPEKEKEFEKLYQNLRKQQEAKLKE